ncbi:MAG: hypothetical protein IKM74_02560 [Bacteroidales bacterium]|nr:hypothetical protein [Bacteroidales bacterium]
MVLLLSNTAAWWIAIGIITVIGGFIGLITLNDDMKEHPDRYREWLEADKNKEKQ